MTGPQYPVFYVLNVQNAIDQKINGREYHACVVGGEIVVMALCGSRRDAVVYCGKAVANMFVAGRLL